jgi:DNA-binding response OmpR family regulator
LFYNLQMSAEINLTPTEQAAYNVIRNAAEENRLASQEEIYAVLYGQPVPDHKKVSDTLAPVIMRLRKKVGPNEIVTRDGIGYFSDSATRY